MFSKALYQVVCCLTLIELKVCRSSNLHVSFRVLNLLHLENLAWNSFPFRLKIRKYCNKCIGNEIM